MKYSKQMYIDVFMAITEASLHLETGSGKFDQSSQEWKTRIAKKHGLSEEAAMHTMGILGEEIVRIERNNGGAFTLTELETYLEKHNVI